MADIEHPDFDPSKPDRESEYFHPNVPRMGYSPEEAIERATNIVGQDLAFDKPWALAIMKGLLTAINIGHRAEAQSPTWISVKDRLPGEAVRVLCCWHDGWQFVGFRGDNGWYNENNRGLDPRVTHWMPLPSGPHG